MSTESDAVAAALAAAMVGPASVSGDAGSVTQQPLPDLIELDKYQRSKDAATKARRGLRFTTLSPDGTV